MTTITPPDATPRFFRGDWGESPEQPIGVMPAELARLREIERAARDSVETWKDAWYHDDYTSEELLDAMKALSAALNPDATGGAT